VRIGKGRRQTGSGTRKEILKKYRYVSISSRLFSDEPNLRVQRASFCYVLEVPVLKLGPEFSFPD
jgi:hypothetical protein